ncbi:hypothetical protein [Ralstonia solanacearum]|uniref:hypothetical protein n=1 Tax=Ralstonia solanacearum TaxID=305 RepID=UPI001E30371E|nr:hypothetical protein [Ralstonia solanacearum]
METDMTATTCTEQLALPAGQSRLHWLPAGTIVVMLDGRLMLEPPPRWLAGDLVRLRHTVAAGHAHTLETSGWWNLHADASAGVHLRLVAPVASTPRWVNGPARACRWLLAAGHPAAAPDLARLRPRGYGLRPAPDGALGASSPGSRRSEALSKSPGSSSPTALSLGTAGTTGRLPPLPPSGCGICGRAGAGFGREGFRSGMAISSRRSGLLAAVLVLAEPLLVLR